MEKNKTIDKILNLKEIKNSQDLYQVIDCIYMYGRTCNEYGDKLTEKLFPLLTNQQIKEYGYGREFFKFILQEYSSGDEELEMLLAISGVSDDYKNLPTAAKCREKYLTYFRKKYTDAPLYDESGMRYREKKALKGITNRVYSEYHAENGQLISRCKKWLSEMGLDPRILEKLDASGYQKEQKPQGAQIKIQTTTHKHKQSNNTKKDKGDSVENPRVSINVIASIKIIYLNVTIERPKYGIYIISVILSIVVPCFCMFYSHNLFLERALYAMRNNSSTDKPKIESINVGENEISVSTGGLSDPLISVEPSKAGKDNLQSKSDDESIAKMTPEWKVAGGTGWKEDEDNTTIITVWGDNAEPVKIKVNLEPGYSDRGDLKRPIDNDEPSEYLSIYNKSKRQE